MPKPTDPALWATDANFVAVGEDWDGEATKVAPSGGRLAEGWEPEMFPPAEEWNWWMNLVGQWTEYLDDGLLEGNHEIDGDLLVTGNISGGYADVEETMMPFACGPADPSLVFINLSPPRLIINESRGTVWTIPGLRVGDRLKNITIAVLGEVTATADLTAINIRKTTPAGATTLIGTTSLSNIPFAWTDVTCDVNPDAGGLIASGEGISLDITNLGTGIAYGVIRWVKDHP